MANKRGDLAHERGWVLRAAGLEFSLFGAICFSFYINRPEISGILSTFAQHFSHTADEAGFYLALRSGQVGAGDALLPPADKMSAEERMQEQEHSETTERE